MSECVCVCINVCVGTVYADLCVCVWARVRSGVCGTDGKTSQGLL